MRLNYEILIYYNNEPVDEKKVIFFLNLKN